MTDRCTDLGKGVRFLDSSAVNELVTCNKHDPVDLWRPPHPTSVAVEHLAAMALRHFDHPTPPVQARLFDSRFAGLVIDEVGETRVWLFGSGSEAATAAFTP